MHRLMENAERVFFFQIFEFHSMINFRYVSEWRALCFRVIGVFETFSFNLSYQTITINLFVSPYIPCFRIFPPMCSSLCILGYIFNMSKYRRLNGLPKTYKHIREFLTKSANRIANTSYFIRKYNRNLKTYY